MIQIVFRSWFGLGNAEPLPNPPSTYMHWNGNFAALPFINKWEYTRNVTWAMRVAYPLLDGLNAWWSAYLVKAADGVYRDFRSQDPDEQHEGQRDANPQIGIALVKRTMLAQLDIAAAAGASPPARPPADCPRTRGA